MPQLQKYVFRFGHALHEHTEYRPFGFHGSHSAAPFIPPFSVAVITFALLSRYREGNIFSTLPAFRIEGRALRRLIHGSRRKDEDIRVAEGAWLNRENVN